MRKFKLVMKYLLAVLFIVAGINHFAHPTFYLKMMPPYLPWHLALVYISGVAEIVLGALVWIRHHANIRRLLRGEEPRIGAGKGKPGH